MNADSRLGWLLLAATLVVFAALPVGAQQTGTTVRHHRVEEPADDPVAPQLDEAEAAIQKQNYDAAEVILMKAVADNPQSYRAWFDLGFVYGATKRPSDAINAYRKSVAANPQIFESTLNLGILLARQGNTDEAVKYLKAATQLKPTANSDEGVARAWLSLGLVQQDAGPQAALDDFAKAASLTPFDPEPHLSAGLLLEKQNKLAEAAHEYQIAATVDQKSTEALAGLANVYTKQKKYADAEAQLRKILDINPNNQNARAQLGQVLSAQGKDAEAAKLATAPANPNSNDPHDALETGTAYVKAGKYSEAEERFRLAVAGLPDDPEAHYALGSVLMQEKQYPEAQLELLTAIKLKPDLGEAYGNLAYVAMQNKDYQLAIRALDARAKFMEENPASYFLRATAYDNLKVTGKAVENYRQFLATDDGKMPDQEWQARHRLMAIDPGNASKYAEKKK
jgi:tetratricopeptide (TPR) repeat protein